MKFKDPNDPLSLEAMIDRNGLPAVIDMLATICGEKAEHLAATWQDASTAKVWDRDATLLRKLAVKVEDGAA